MNEPLEESEHPTINKQTKYFILIGSLVLLAIFLFVMFGLRSKVPDELNTIEYNYFTFTEVAGFWHVNIEVKGQLYEAIFRFSPEQVQDVQFSGTFDSFKEPIYITFDPDADSEQFKYLALASSELSLHLIRALNLSVVASCTKNETDACIDRPVVTCDDKDKNVIYLVPNPPTKVTIEDNCITLSGSEFDVVKSVDRLLYQNYRVIT